MTVRKNSVFLLLVFMIASSLVLGKTRTVTPLLSQSPFLPSFLLGTPVVFAGKPLFVVDDKLAPFTPQERAQTITDRLRRSAIDPSTILYFVRSQPSIKKQRVNSSIKK